MSGEPLRGPSMIFFLEGGVVKIFFLGGGGVKEGFGVLCFLDLEWSSEQALRATHPCVCYRSKSHSGNNNHHHHHLATMINDLIINDNN